MAQPTAGPSSRLVSLDAFRGATIALMVLVNTAGDGSHVYAQLEHAEWHGWTLTDCVFPSFVWIMGVALTLSLAKRMAAGADRKALFLGILRRGAILYALGLFLYGFPHFDLAKWRILGVLQRIALCYVFASAVFLTTGIRGQIAWVVGLLTSYWLLMTLVPVPGYGAGRLDVEGNFAHYIDNMVLGRHNYGSTKTWDPEGIVSTLPAFATALFGVLAGHVMRIKQDLSNRVVRMALIGLALIVAGLLANVWMPINKKLWTPSFSMFMAGLDFVSFGLFAWLIDGKGVQKPFRPFVILGMNAIAIYMASELIDAALWELGWRKPLYQAVFAPLASPINASLIYAVTYVALMFVIAYVMYRRRWFLKV